MSGHFTFPACRRIARFFGLTYIPKYRADDILTESFVDNLARKIYRTNSLTAKSERLAQSMFWVFYKEGILALEIMVCGMLPPESEVRVPERIVPDVAEDPRPACPHNMVPSQLPAREVPSHAVITIAAHAANCDILHIDSDDTVTYKHRDYECSNSTTVKNALETFRQIEELNKNKY